MIRKIYLLFAFLVTALCTANLYAQTTHAHSTSRHWHGIDVLEIWEHRNDDAWLNANYPKIKIKQTYTNGKPDSGCGYPVYLYNVGTDKFTIEGGNWGMESRLFYNDFGRCMKLILEETSPGNNNWKLRFNADVTQSNSTEKCRLTLNVATVTRSDEWNSTDMSFTSILDGYKRNANWDFERVESDPASDTYTFRMSQKYTQPSTTTYWKTDASVKDMTFRFGAVYGEWWCPDRGDGKWKGNGYYVHIDDDRSCWTSAGNDGSDAESPWDNHTKVQVGSDMIEIDELYQWRIISQDEFIRVLNDETVGLNPSISSLVPDRDFTRNSKEFEYWEKDHTDDVVSETGVGRYGYTYGFKSPGTSSNATYQNKNTYNNEPWNSPLILKCVRESLNDAKYSYMSFEGCGTAYVRFEVPRAGWYEIESRAISFGPEDHPVYLYAMTDGAAEVISDDQSALTAASGYQQMRITNLTGISQLSKYVDLPKNPDKSNVDAVVAVGKVLTLQAEDFIHKFWIYVDPTKYQEEGKGLTIGIKKEYATKTYKGTNDDIKYYYDSDLAVLDNIQISYMGLAPSFFYEEEESLDYLVFDKDKIPERPGAAPDNKYAGSVSLARTLKKGQWNSFSMPIPLTGEQVRSAFGEDCQLLELHSIGGLSHNASVIDFQSVGLKPVDPLEWVVVPGKFYLLKPTADPNDGLDPRGIHYDYYDLGRNYFTVNPDVNSGKSEGDADYYTHYILDPAVMSASQSLPSWNGTEAVTDGENDGTASITYVQTPGYSTFAVTDGIYNGSQATPGLYAPKGAYVYSNNRMYEINKDTRLKGFRGWITLTSSVFAQPTSAKVSVDGVVDYDGSTGIGDIQVIPATQSGDGDIYDLGGRKVGTQGTSLTRGIYVTDGKKLVVDQ